MKRIQKWMMAAAALFMVAGSLPAQAQDLKEFFSNDQTPLVYLGVDFTRTKVINDYSASAADIKERHMHSINQLVINETKNYNLTEAFNKNNISADLSAVEEQNGKIKESDITSSDPAEYQKLTENDISAMVKKLGHINGSGIGLIFIMDGMRKNDKKGEGTVWVTLIDIKSRKVLMAERMEEDAAGFGFRNFWASVIKRAIQDINKKKYKEWKKKYGN
ncbi:MAG: hypothetical protein U0X40_00125 [Ferruginibacter sp.]